MAELQTEHARLMSLYDFLHNEDWQDALAMMNRLRAGRTTSPRVSRVLAGTVAPVGDILESRQRRANANANAMSPTPGDSSAIMSLLSGWLLRRKRVVVSHGLSLVSVVSKTDEVIQEKRFGGLSSGQGFPSHKILQ
ncbi:hypothetical protein ED733_005866 [Metarhizium rileyi]|uniref:Uncharacterized protein n=1 Tax=Metarhizium rileyi (strain RCEF 4871) TaxID=1649241 RepID=A0A5C6G9T8_METRR|nr:hypothetical protein ED733_005866 [Metarhizium rileyi]